MNLSQHTMMDLGLSQYSWQIFFFAISRSHSGNLPLYIIVHGNMTLNWLSKNMSRPLVYTSYFVPSCTKRQTRTAVWQVFVSCRSKGYEIKFWPLQENMEAHLSRSGSWWLGTMTVKGVFRFKAAFFRKWVTKSTLCINSHVALHNGVYHTLVHTLTVESSAKSSVIYRLVLLCANLKSVNTALKEENNI